MHIKVQTVQKEMVLCADLALRQEVSPNRMNNILVQLCLSDRSLPTHRRVNLHVGLLKSQWLNELQSEVKTKPYA